MKFSKCWRIAQAASAGLALSALAGAACAQPSPATALPARHARAGFQPGQMPVRSLAGLTAPRPGLYVPAGPLVPRLAPNWVHPGAGADLLASATLPGSTLRPPAATTSATWTNIGPAPIGDAGGTFGGAPAAVSGRATALAVDPTNSNTFYVGAASGGVWKTTDGGQTYTSLSDSTFADLAIGAIAVDPNSPNTLYVGTGEPNNSGDSQYGLGVYKSTDGGQTWTLYTGPSNVFVLQAVSKIVVDPSNSNTVYLSLATAFQTPAPFGVYKSTDGGVTWANTTASITTDVVYSDLVMDPTHPQTLYAAVGDLFNEDEFTGADYGVYDGVYKTTDGGGHWALAGNFPQGTPVGRISLALAASAPNTVYASIQDTGAQSGNFGGLLGLFKTADGGTTWNDLPNTPDYLQQQGWYDNTLTVSPTNPNLVFGAGQVNYNYAFGSSQPYGHLTTVTGSRDGGQTWTDYAVGAGGRGPHTDVHPAAFTPDGRLLFGADGGVWRLENPTNSSPTIPSDPSGTGSNINWTDVNGNLDTIQFTGIGLDPTNASIAYGGSQDNGTEKYTGSAAWTQIVGGDGGFTRVDQSNPQTIYQEYYGINLSRSDDGGQTFTFLINGINPYDQTGSQGGPVSYQDRSAFYVPYILDPGNQSRVLYPTDHLYESLNRGDLFRLIATPGRSGFNAFDETLNALGVNGSTIYAATNYNLYATGNDGHTWADRSIPQFKNDYTHYQGIAVNPANPLDLTVVLGTFTGVGEVWHSTNGGAGWSNISGNLPDEPYNAIAIDRAAGVIYVGAADGVYASTNGGGSWSRYGAGLPAVQVVDLQIEKGLNILGAGTHGRGLWEIPLISAAAAPKQ